ncbi:L-histidine N(alpha)-methyltransferase [soil metagenome]
MISSPSSPTIREVVEPTVERHLDPNWARTSLVQDVQRGLGRHPLRLPPKWLYDDRGSDLFDQITRLPEYYPTEAERSILEREAANIALLSGADTIVELGSGTSDKMRTLLDTFWDTGQLERFVPFDVSEATLRDAAGQLSQRYPGLRVHGIIGDFTLHLAQLPRDGAPMVAFLGSTIGNLYVEERRSFLSTIADNLPRGGSLLLGADLVKPVDRLIAAYDDDQGVTAAFTRNMLSVLNRELQADFQPETFDHVAFWAPVHERMDLRLRVNDDQTVQIPGAGLTVELHDGEEIRVEVCTKFRVSTLSKELEDAGFDVRQFWTDDSGDFGLVLATARGVRLILAE